MSHYPTPSAADTILSSVQNARPQQQVDPVLLFAQEVMPDVNTNPLDWWRTNGAARYPQLVTLAVKYLGIPATSVPSERIFSKTGEILNRRRASLKPPNLVKIGCKMAPPRGGEI